MTNSTRGVTLALLKAADDAKRERLLVGIAGLQLAPGQDAFVGDPAAMAAAALAGPGRHPFAILSAAHDGEVVGMGVLHVGVATDTGWPDNDGTILLRGFLIDHRRQGLGYGTRATLAAVELAKELAQEFPAGGVVLGVNERNAAGKAAYLKAGFTDRGQYLGGRSGPQRIIYRPFVNIS